MPFTSEHVPIYCSSEFDINISANQVFINAEGYRRGRQFRSQKLRETIDRVNCPCWRGHDRSQSCVIFSEPGAAQSKRNCGQFIIAVARRRRRSALAEKRREKGNDGRTAVVSQRERNYKCYPRDVNSTGIEIIPRPRRRSPRLFINSHCSLIPSTALPAMPLII